MRQDLAPHCLSRVLAVHRAGAVHFYVTAMHHTMEALLLHVDNVEDDLINEALELLSIAGLLVAPLATASALHWTSRVHENAGTPLYHGEPTPHDRLSDADVEQVRSTTQCLIGLVKAAMVEIAAQSEIEGPLVLYAA